MLAGEVVATAPFMSARGEDRLIPHRWNLCPYKIVMWRILTHKCVTLNAAYQ